MFIVPGSTGLPVSSSYVATATVGLPNTIADAFGMLSLENEAYQAVSLVIDGLIPDLPAFPTTPLRRSGYMHYQPLPSFPEGYPLEVSQAPVVEEDFIPSSLPAGYPVISRASIEAIGPIPTVTVPTAVIPGLDFDPLMEDEDATLSSFVEIPAEHLPYTPFNVGAEAKVVKSLPVGGMGISTFNEKVMDPFFLSTCF
jgi:hypothetical protein